MRRWNGSCTGSYRLTFVEEKKGRLFVNTPNALEGNRVEKCDSASAQFQSVETGLVDGIGTEEEILGQIRTLVSMLPENNEDNDSFKECTDDLNRVCDDIAGCTGDTVIALSRIADDGEFFETKAAYGQDVVTGFLRLNGATVGLLQTEANLTMLMAIRQRFPTELFLQEVQEKQQTS